MRILMLVATSVATDTRVLREAGALVDAGHTIHIIGKAVPPDFPVRTGITVTSAGQPPLSTQRTTALNPMQLCARWFLLPRVRARGFGLWSREAEAQARELEYDVVHAHDFTALALGAALATARGVPLIYDSHELWSGRQRQYRPTPLQDWRERRIEKHLGARAQAVITVGDGVAAALRKRYGWRHVSVVRNSFPMGVANASAPSVATAPQGLVYAGRIDAHRELETVIAASAALPVPVILVGPTDENWLARQQQALAGAAIDVRAPLDVDGVTALLRQQGMALVTHSDRFESYRLAMPNKLFHAVHAGVPVIASDAPAVRELVQRYELGQTYRIGDANDLARAVRDVVANYARYLSNVNAAARELSWETDAATLVGIYDEIGRAAG